MRVGQIVSQDLMSLRLDDVHLVTSLRLPSIEVYGPRLISLEEWMREIENGWYKHLRSYEVYPSPLERWNTVLEPNHESDLGLCFESLV